VHYFPRPFNNIQEQQRTINPTINTK